MNSTQISNQGDPELRQRATEWLVAFCEGEVDASGRASFDRWLRTSPAHVEAYLQICAVWEGAGLLVESTGTNVRELIERARSENHVQDPLADNIPSNKSSVARMDSHRPKAWNAWHAIAAGVVLLSVIAGGFVWWQLTRTPIYETGAAEQRDVRLPDGSTVRLNARSRIELHFTRQERAVDLVEGQALFSVAQDARRAFVVGSDDARVRALGTQFDLYRKLEGTVITVIQGQVAIQVDSLSVNNAHRQGTDVSGPTPAVLVSAGEQAVATSRSPVHPYRANVGDATAWTKGMLVFDSVQLRDVVAEFNRIGVRRLVVEDHSLLGLRINGVFPAGDPSGLIDFLRARFGVSTSSTNQEIRIVGKASK